MFNIYLMRHGDVEGGSLYRGSQDDPLSEKGLQQMHLAMQHIPNDIPYVFSSPLQRCLSFAQKSPILKNCLSIEAKLKEIHFGEWEGRRFDQIPKTELNDYFKDPYSHTPPQGEKLIDFDTRVISAWNNIIKHHQVDSNSLIITHAGVIRSILKQCLDMSLNSTFNLNIAHACVIHLKVGFDNEQAFVQLMNLNNLTGDSF